MTSLETTSPKLKPGGYNIFTAVVLARNPGGDFGGYKSRYFINPVEPQCAFCRQVPREPHRVACGHIFCQDCLFTNIVTPRQPCNQCHAPVRRDDCVMDIQLTRRIAESSISCPFHEKCRWAGYLSNLSLHFSECTHVNPMIRSWMQSIQSHISDVTDESGRLERRVDRLSELIKKMTSNCEAATYEYEKQLSWIGNQMTYLQQDVAKASPKKQYTPPTYNPPVFHMPDPLQDFPSLDINEGEMTESLRFDLGRMRGQKPPVQEDPIQPPRRNIKFSVYEDHVRKDSGDAEFELDALDDVEVFQHDDPTFFIPDQPLYQNTEFPKCLHCTRFSVPGSKNCEFCERIL